MAGFGGIVTYFAYKAYVNLKYDTNRPMINFAANKFQHPLRITEIGVFYGTNARRMFKKLKIEKMFLVDPYKKYQGYENEKNVLTFLPSSFKPALLVLKKFSDRVVPLQMTSEDAVDHIPKNLDMVYIDGNHAYEYVKKDIELYYPKVKPGGIIGGHDIEGNSLGEDVRRAVFEFAHKNNLSVQVEEPDWWIIKEQ
ncbi:MAG: class I SAM-dependent methyltransferase [Candidatus Thermoplasmatota archaeon]|nr:class I SAM-dependent methyltransferase [Candidatus Thermoplasmatota archaeon]